MSNVPLCCAPPHPCAFTVCTFDLRLSGLYCLNWWVLFIWVKTDKQHYHLTCNEAVTCNEGLRKSSRALYAASTAYDAHMTQRGFPPRN